jgi:hypothetical protein
MPRKLVRASDDDARELDKPADEDTEGHNMLLDPSTARHLARSREQEIQRGARDRQREKEARRR